MGNFNWLQFSDLHFSTRDSFDTRLARKALFECLKKEDFKCNYVFITGDIADKNNYTFAKEYIEEMMELIGVGKDMIFWAVGNHDIKRGFGYRGEIIANIRNASSPSHKFETAMADDEMRVILTQIGMSSYINEYKRILGRELSASEISDAHVFYNLGSCNLVVLNTCLTSCDNEDPHRLMIIEPRLFRVFDKLTDKSKPLIVIGHHDKAFFHNSEQGKLAQLFEDAGVDLYLCGHSHRLGYARFDDSERDIPQITCGGGNIDGYNVLTFMLGEYDADNHSVRITPYSYSDRGTRQFSKDFSLHRRLTEYNNTFILSRLSEYNVRRNFVKAYKANHPASDCEFAAELVPNIPLFSLEDNDLFVRSEKHFSFMRSEEGRFSFLRIEEQLFPEAKSIDTLIRGDNDDILYKLIDVMEDIESENLLIIGDGGMGKTTSLLRIWELRLDDKTELPFYIPLNEYQNQPEFIRSYIKLYYGQIDIHNLNRRFVLLLDGFNETYGEKHHLVREINDLLLKHTGHIRIIGTSRHDFIKDYQLKTFKPYHLQPLSETTVRGFVTSNNQSLDDDALEVLKTPMMLTLYTQTSAIQEKAKRDNIIDDKDFKDNKTRGEILYNYMLCQIAKLVINGQLNEIISKWYALFTVAPYIAYHMESSNRFYIDKDEFIRLSSMFTKRYALEQHIVEMPTRIRNLVNRNGIPAELSVSMEDVLVYEQYLIIEENKQYTFRHQYFRDFLAALHIANVIRESLATKPFVLPKEVSSKLWSVHTRDMLGDYFSDYRNKDIYGHHTLFHELLEKLRDMTKTESGMAVNNVLETWRRARNNRIVGEDLTRLDLSQVPLNGVAFSSYYGASSFDCSIISDITLLPLGHSGSVNSAVYSKNEEMILSASDDETLKEWNRETGECIHTFRGHSGRAMSAIYNADGKMILSASDDGCVKEWDRETGECLRTFIGHTSCVKSAVYSRDEKYVISSSSDNTIKEWDKESAECLLTLVGHSNIVRSAIYSEDEKYILSASDDRTIREWNRATGECLRTFEGHSDRVKSAVYSTDGKKVLSASDDESIKLWDRETCKCLQTFTEHIDKVYSAIYNQDGQYILSASGDGTIREWDSETGECLRVFEGHFNKVMRAVYSADGCRILSSSHDGKIKEWDRESNECLQTCDGYSSWIEECRYSNDETYALSPSNDGTAKEWNIKTGNCRMVFVGHSRTVHSAVYSTDGRRILTGSTDGCIKEWDRDSGECLSTIKTYSDSTRNYDRVRSVSYSEDEMRILFASEYKTIRELDRKTGECLRTFTGHTSWVNDAMYSKDERFVLSVSDDGTIKEWNRETGECLNTFYGHSSRVRGAVYSKHGDKILSASDDGTIKEWNRKSGKCLRTFVGHGNYVSCVGYSSDESRMLSTSADKTIKEWTLENGECLQTFVGHSEWVTDAVYSKDEKRILSSSKDGSLKEWERETGKCLWTTPTFGGVFIAGCDFKGCQFTSPEIEHLVKVYGGNVLIPTLCSIQAEYLRGERRQIDISLSDDKPMNLIITGPNGSGKTSLLEGIKETVEFILSFNNAANESPHTFIDNTTNEVSLAFSNRERNEAETVLWLEHCKGHYKFMYFSDSHSYDGGFWERLDKIQAAIHQFRSEGYNEKALSLLTWLDKIKVMLKDLFVNESIRLDFDEKRQEFRVYYKLNSTYAEFELDRNILPHGFSSVLNIYNTIMTNFGNDVTVLPERYRGLVIIDELESHLHVNMQKRIFPLLTKLFPKLQFIVATHSPFIINSAKDALVYDMARDEIGNGLEGWSLVEVLRDVLGVNNERSDILNKAITDYEKAYAQYKRSFGEASDKLVREKYTVLRDMLNDGNPLKEVLRIQMSGVGGDCGD